MSGKSDLFCEHAAAYYHNSRVFNVWGFSGSEFGTFRFAGMSGSGGL